VNSVHNAGILWDLESIRVERYLETRGGHRGIKAARAQYDAWRAIAESAHWKTPQDVKKAHPKASILKSGRVVFNINLPSRSLRSCCCAWARIPSSCVQVPRIASMLRIPHNRLPTIEVTKDCRGCEIDRGDDPDATNIGSKRRMPRQSAESQNARGLRCIDRSVALGNSGGTVI
jgi:hypothetical protein